MKITEVYCDYCNTQIERRVQTSGGAGALDTWQEKSIEIWSEKQDLTFCSINCLRTKVGTMKDEDFK